MADQKANSPMPAGGGGGSETERELFSEHKAKFIEDLECLYIKNNQSGRLMFADKWPLIAERMFDPKLTHYDHEGAATEEEREERVALEDKAVDKQEEFLKIFSGLDKKLVVYGSLQVKELEKLMEKIDRPLAELVFSERFVDKFFPKAPSAPGAASSASTEKPSESGTSPSTNVESAEQTPERSETITPEKPAEKPQKENVVVPDIETESIGHVDHSYNTRTPVYDAQKGENGEDDGDDGASWLDMPEDEFDDIMPISTETNQAKADEPEKAAPTMGLKAHQGSRGDEPLDNPAASEEAPQSSDTPEQASQPAPETPRQDERLTPPPPQGMGMGMGARPPQAPPPEESRQEPSAPPPPPAPEERAAPQAPPPPQAPQAPSSPPPPSGMGLRAHQQSHGGGQSPSEPPQAEQSQQAPQPSAPQAPPPPQAPQSPPPPQGMGMGGRPQPETPPAPPAQSQPTSPGAPPLPGSSAPPLPGSDNAGSEGSAPRKPSLDDIDKHLGRDKPSSPPPLPGSDDDKSRY